MTDLVQPQSPVISEASPLARLQKLARRPQDTRHKPQQSPEQCELCAAPIHSEHQHLLEISTRKLICACDACAVLFSGHENQRYRRVPRRVVAINDLEFGESLWAMLGIPVHLAFFYRNSQAGRILAVYPSPGGATESQLPMDAWEDLVAARAPLKTMAPDVEALIVNHVRPRRDCYLVSIDQCYKLVGLIRTNWRGFTGGEDMRHAVADFFDELHRRSERRAGGGAHA